MSHVVDFMESIVLKVKLLSSWTMRNVGLRQTKTVTMTKPLTIQTLVAADSLGRVDAHWNDAVSVVAEEATR